MNFIKKYDIVIGFASLMLLSIICTLSFHNKKDFGSYRNALFADKAGYYVYLPYLLEYNSDRFVIDSALVKNVGSGFSITEEGKVFTKYPMGVALFELPFYLIAREWNTNEPNEVFNPFNDAFRNIMIWCSVFYVFIGLIFLYKSLRLISVSKFNSMLTVAFVYTGTNLFYYTIGEGLMSHAYSFTLFSLFGFYWIRLIQHDSKIWRTRILLAIIIGLIGIVRPFNVVMIPFISVGMAMLLRFNFLDIVKREWNKLLPIILLISPIFFIPQLLYYKHVFGEYLVYSYQGESFNFSDPHFLDILIHPITGLFIYIPAFIILFGLLAYRSISDPKRYLFSFITILGFVYLYSSWHSWWYGCGLSVRQFIEWLPFLAIPLSLSLRESYKNRKVYLTIGVLVFIYNINMTYKWKGCYFGEEKTYSEFYNYYLAPHTF